MELKQIIKEELHKVAQDKVVLADILDGANLNEAVDFSAVLQKVKSYAAKGLLTATVIAGLMSSPALSQEQKSQIQSITSERPIRKSVSDTPETRLEWNSFIDWVGQTYPDGVSDSGQDPTGNIVARYKEVNPNTVIDASNIKDFQTALKNYNEKWKTLQKNYRPQGNTLSAPSPVDNRIGSVTSKMKFPEVTFMISGRPIKFRTDIDRAIITYQDLKGVERQDTPIKPVPSSSTAYVGAGD